MSINAFFCWLLGNFSKTKNRTSLSRETHAGISLCSFFVFHGCSTYWRSCTRFLVRFGMVFVDFIRCSALIAISCVMIWVITTITYLFRIRWFCDVFLVYWFLGLWYVIDGVRPVIVSVLISIEVVSVVIEAASSFIIGISSSSKSSWVVESVFPSIVQCLVVPLIIRDRWWVTLNVVIRFERSFCCCFNSSCCCGIFVSAPTKFSGSEELTSLNASLDQSSLRHSSKNTIRRLVTIHKSCTVAASFWLSIFLLMKLGMVFVKLSLILLFLSFTALLTVTWLAVSAAFTLSISTRSPDGFACGIGAKTGSGYAWVAFICTWTKRSSGLPILWSKFKFWSCNLRSFLTLGLQ